MEKHEVTAPPPPILKTPTDRGAQIPANFVLWSTGIAMNPFTARVSSLLPNQVHRKAIETDAHLRVKGAPLGDVYAIGDCATVRHGRPSSVVGGES